MIGDFLPLLGAINHYAAQMPAFNVDNPPAFEGQKD
jgi:hypothetical protein